MNYCIRKNLSLILRAIACLSIASPACGALTVAVQPSLTFSTPDSTGSVEIVLTNNGTNAVEVGGFSFTFSVDGSGVQFSQVVDPTIAPYIFQDIGSGSVNVDTFPNATLSFLDFVLESPGYRTVGGGESYGIAKIDFIVTAAASAGTRTLAISDLILDLLFSEEYSVGNGFVEVQISEEATDAVPEPTTWSMFFLGIATISFSQFSRGRASRQLCIS